MCYHLLGANPWASVRGRVQRYVRLRPVLERPTAWGVTDVNRMSLHGDRSEGKGYGRQGLELTGAEAGWEGAASELRRGRG